LTRGSGRKALPTVAAGNPRGDVGPGYSRGRQSHDGSAAAAGGLPVSRSRGIVRVLILKETSGVNPHRVQLVRSGWQTRQISCRGFCRGRNCRCRGRGKCRFLTRGSGREALPSAVAGNPRGDVGPGYSRGRQSPDGSAAAAGTRQECGFFLGPWHCSEANF